MPFNPEMHRAPKKHEKESEAFDWNKESERLSGDLTTLNDPTSLLEYLHNFPNGHMESDHWDEYLEWVNNHADTFLQLAASDIPDVADLAIMVLSDTHAFLEERDLENESREKIEQLRNKIIDFFSSHTSLFTADEKAAPYRFGLRVQTLSKIAWLSEEQDQATHITAQFMGLQALKRGWTPQDRKSEMNLNGPDLAFDVGNIVDDYNVNAVEKVAQDIAARIKINLDLRQERLPEANKEKKISAHRQHLSEWIATVMELEGNVEGAAHELQDRFGIRNFHHFPLDLLKQQYELRDMDVPYGLIIAAEYDHNDAFNGMASIDVLKSFNDQLANRGVHARVIEVDSPRELATRFLSLDSKYGPKNKISFALVRAHGEYTGVQLGASGTSFVSSEGLTKLRPENLKRFFIDKPNIIFDSCSTGVEEGLAQNVAQLVGATTWGSPTKFTGIEHIEVSGSAEHLEFSITPREDDVELNIYKG